MSLEVLAPSRSRADAVDASLLFLEPSPRKPRVEVSYDAGVLPATELYAPRRVRLQDARPLGASLDADGFELQRHVSRVDDFYDEDLVADLGRAETAQFGSQQVTEAARAGCDVTMCDDFHQISASNFMAATSMPATRRHRCALSSSGCSAA